MAKTKTPKKTPAKASSSAGPIDLEDPNINSAITAACVAVLGVALGGGVPKSIGDGLNMLTLGGLNSDLHATWWPFSLVFTLHVLNTCQSNGKWWVNDIVNCCFNAFGALMIQDLLKGDFTMSCIFENGEKNLSLLIVLWYFSNHSLPFTSINLYEIVVSNVGKVLPLENIMELCTVIFNMRLLIATAAATNAASGCALIPMALGKGMMMCAVVNSAQSFFTQKGVNFHVGNACSQKIYEACIVCFWYATNGLAGLPFAGQYLALATAPVEGFFGGRDSFVLTLAVLNFLLGHLIPIDPCALVIDKLYTITGMNRK